MTTSWMHRRPFGGRHLVLGLDKDILREIGTHFGFFQINKKIEMQISFALL